MSMAMNGLVFDNQDVGRDLGRELAAGFLDQARVASEVDLQDLCRLILGEAFRAPPAGKPAAGAG